MGIIPLFNWGERPFFVEKFIFINKHRSRIKVFQPLEGGSKAFSVINSILISQGCVHKRSSKSFMKASRFASFEEAREEYKNYQKKIWKKLIDSIVF